MKKFVFALLLLLSFVALGVWQRHFIMFSVTASGEPPPLLDAVPEDEDSYWYDDYFLIEPIDSRTFAIGEPRYAQQNYSYLILGNERGILFDAGPGYRDIRPVTSSLTDLPITFIPSHFHYDHIGNTITFNHVAVIDLPYLRERAVDNRLRITWEEHLGFSEGVDAPTLEVNEWLLPNSVIDLGGRELQVLYTPGHTEDSVSLLDLASGALFSGDFIYPGFLYAFLPTSDMGDYLDGANTVLEILEGEAQVFGAHRGREGGIPTLTTEDVNDLRVALFAIRDGTATATGVHPRVYNINERLNILTEPRWLQSW